MANALGSRSRTTHAVWGAISASFLVAACGGSQDGSATSTQTAGVTTSGSGGGTSAQTTGITTSGSGGGPPVTVADCSNLPAPGVWENVTPPLATPNSNPCVIQVDPLNSGTIYVQQHTGGNGAHDPSDGLRVSRDCGAHWDVVPAGKHATDADSPNINFGTWASLLIDPFDSKLLYTVSNYGPGGVWRSQNGGTDWDQLVPDDVAQYVNSLWFNGLTMDPTNHQHLIAVTHAGCTGPYAPNCMAETRDAGMTWTLTTLPDTWQEGNGMQIFDDQTFIWVTGENGMFLTKDGGKTWNNVFSGGSGAGSGTPLYKASSGDYYMASLYGVIRSKASDLTNWEKVQGGMFINLVGTGQNMVASNYGALTYWTATDAAPATWTPMSGPTSAMQQTGSQPDSPTTGSYFMVYDAGHHLLYASNYYALLRTVVP